MSGPALGRWVALDLPKRGVNWAKWVAVRDHGYPAVPGLVTPDDVHRWARRHVSHHAEPSDHWQTPSETYQRQQGDCEDIALLERAELLALGVAETSMWLLICFDLIAHRDHAMLIVGDQFLDQRAATALPLDKWTDYRPIEAFQHDTFVTFGWRVSDGKQGA